MLQYIDGPKRIRVLRTDGQAAGANRVVLGTIKKDRGKFRAAAPTTKEEMTEILAVAAARRAVPATTSREVPDLKSREALDAKSIVLNLPETLRMALDYCGTQANDDEKKLVATAIGDAARHLQVSQPAPAADKGPSPQKEQAEAPNASLPTAKELAAALFKALSQSHKETKVSGDPAQGKKTRIMGLVDLNDLASKVLSQAPS